MKNSSTETCIRLTSYEKFGVKCLVGVWFHTGCLKNVFFCIIAWIRCYVYKVLGINSPILLHLYGYEANIKNINSISLKFIMITDNNQIFRNRFVIIHRHLTKFSAQIIQCIIFDRNELYNTIKSTILLCSK